MSDNPEPRYSPLCTLLPGDVLFIHLESSHTQELVVELHLAPPSEPTLTAHVSLHNGVGHHIMDETFELMGLGLFPSDGQPLAERHINLSFKVLRAARPMEDRGWFLRLFPATEDQELGIRTEPQ